ncbi:MAG: hypothetical protein RSE97_08945, partial [Oscillospiraceae bacterium]
TSALGQRERFFASLRMTEQVGQNDRIGGRMTGIKVKKRQTDFGLANAHTGGPPQHPCEKNLAPPFGGAFVIEF